MFSPKVLDRANVIEFNEVDLKAYVGREIEQKMHFSLQNGDVLDSFFNASASLFCQKEDYLALDDQAKEYLEKLQGILKEYNLHFGYRVANELGRFVNLAMEEIGDSCLDDAVDIQIIQKILPKLHGTRAKLEEPLQRIFAFCHSQSTPFSEELLHRSISGSSDFRFFRSAQKISRMLSQLAVQGYTSFVE